MNRSKDLKISYKAVRTALFIALAIFGAFLNDTTNLDMMSALCVTYGIFGSVISAILK